MSEIYLSSGGLVLLDEVDYFFLCGFNWRLVGKYPGRTGRKGESYNVYLHLEVAKRMGLDTSKEIDHIDRNRFNAKRDNLRMASDSQTSMNKSMQSNNTSGFRGVSYDKGCRIFKAYITKDRRRIHLGCFETALEAAEAYNKAATILHGEFIGEVSR